AISSGNGFSDLNTAIAAASATGAFGDVFAFANNVNITSGTFVLPSSNIVFYTEDATSDTGTNATIAGSLSISGGGFVKAGKGLLALTGAEVLGGAVTLGGGTLSVGGSGITQVDLSTSRNATLEGTSSKLDSMTLFGTSIGASGDVIA